VYGELGLTNWRSGERMKEKPEGLSVKAHERDSWAGEEVEERE